MEDIILIFLGMLTIYIIVRILAAISEWLQNYTPPAEQKKIDKEYEESKQKDIDWVKRVGTDEAIKQLQCKIDKLDAKLKNWYDTEYDEFGSEYCSYDSEDVGAKELYEIDLRILKSKLIFIRDMQ